MTFTNVFGDEIKSVAFIYDQPIKAGAEVYWKSTTGCNRFIEEDHALRQKEVKDIKVLWKPQKLIFNDGTLLE